MMASPLAPPDGLSGARAPDVTGLTVWRKSRNFFLSWPVSLTSGGSSEPSLGMQLAPRPPAPRARGDSGTPHGWPLFPGLQASR